MPTPQNLATHSCVAVLVAEGLEEVEALSVVDVLFRAGIRADLIAVGEELMVESSHGIRFQCDYLASDVNLADYDVLFLPGGMPGTLHLKESPVVIEELERRKVTLEPVAAICAAPSILADVGLVHGFNATANPNFMDALIRGGAHPREDAVVVDGHVMTSRGMGTAIELGLEIVSFLLGEDAVNAVKKGIVYSR